MKIFKEILPYLIIVIVVVLIRSFIITPVVVDGLSMYPTLDDGQVLLLLKCDKTYERNDIVVVKAGNEEIIKRVIGLPGEKVLYNNNKLYIDGKEVDDKFSIITSDYDFKKEIPNDYYLVLGDNRVNSVDSRILGFISKKDIIGTVNFRLTGKFGKIE